jgi:hypothetical protein
VPLVLGLAASSALALIVLKFRSVLRSLALAICIVGVLALHIAPAMWAITPLMGGDGGLPFAGPELLARRPPPNVRTDNRLVDYLRANRGGAKFLVAAINANTAAPIILTTGEAVMTVGGFGGNDRILSVEQLAARVRNNEVRFFLLPQQGDQQAELQRWITNRCAPVPPQQFSSLPAPRPGGPPQPNSDLRLFDCAHVRP